MLITIGFPIFHCSQFPQTPLGFEHIVVLCVLGFLNYLLDVYFILLSSDLALWSLVVNLRIVKFGDTVMHLLESSSDHEALALLWGLVS
jgi:hypothetical protein